MSVVHIYKSTDPGAPPHPSNTQGSMANLLRACLVSGYGSGGDLKTPAGWEEPFVETNGYACFRALLGTARQFYQIDDATTDADVTQMTSFDSMSDAETGFGPRGQVYFGKWNCPAGVSDWVVVADETTCYVILGSLDSDVLHGFGEYQSLIEGDPCPSFLAGHNDSTKLSDNDVDLALHHSDYINGTSLRAGYLRRCISSPGISSFSMLNYGTAKQAAPAGSDFYGSTAPVAGMSWIHLPVVIKAIDDAIAGVLMPCGILRGLRAPLTYVGGDFTAAGKSYYRAIFDGIGGQNGCLLIQVDGSWG